MCNFWEWPTIFPHYCRQQHSSLPHSVFFLVLFFGVISCFIPDISPSTDTSFESGPLHGSSIPTGLFLFICRLGNSSDYCLSSPPCLGQNLSQPQSSISACLGDIFHSFWKGVSCCRIYIANYSWHSVKGSHWSMEDLSVNRLKYCKPCC